MEVVTDTIDDETAAVNYYVPTREEIRQACLEIQAGWSERERESRHVGKPRVMVNENRVYRVNCGE